MNIINKLYLNKIVTIVILLFSITSLFAQDERIVKISGFSGISFESSFGEPADKKIAESLQLYGNEELAEITESHDEIKTEGLAFVFLSNLHEKLVFQSEIFIHGGHDGLETELERFYIDYKLHDKFNIRAGKFLTQVGYLNRFQHTHGYLNKSVLIRDMVDDEKGLIPVEMVGLSFFGDFLNNDGTSGIRYIMSLGSGRGQTPDTKLFVAGESFNFTGLLEYHTFIGDETELLLGISGYHIPKFNTINISDDDLAEEFITHEAEQNFGLVEFKESGFIPFIKLNTSRFEILSEFHSVTMKDNGVLGNQSFTYNGLSTQLAFNLFLAKKPLFPYIRFDSIDLPTNGGPYYGVDHQGGDKITRTFIGDSQVLMLGAALDPLPFNRIKIEYQHHLKGAHVKSKFIVASTFAF